jgi:hypothetical protein
MAPNIIYGIRMLLHLSSGNVLKTLTLPMVEGKSLQIALMILENGWIWTYKTPLKNLSF